MSELSNNMLDQFSSTAWMTAGTNKCCWQHVFQPIWLRLGLHTVLHSSYNK